MAVIEIQCISMKYFIFLSVPYGQPAAFARVGGRFQNSSLFQFYVTFFGNMRLI